MVIHALLLFQRVAVFLGSLQGHSPVSRDEGAPRAIKDI
jgi:hypothetical protein